MLRHAARLGYALATALILETVWVADALAEASFAPGVTPETVAQSSLDPTVLSIIVLAAAFLALVVVARGPSRRSAVGVVLGVLAFLFGGILVLAGLFGDLSGRHEVFVVPLATGIAVMAGAVFGIWRLRSRREPARSASDRPIG